MFTYCLIIALYKKIVNVRKVYHHCQIIALYKIVNYEVCL